MIQVRRTGAPARLLIAIIGTLGLLVGIALGAPAAQVRAAGPGLTMVGAATYDVRPASRLVHVTVQLTATNHLADSVIHRYTFDRVQVSIPPTASHPSASVGTKAVALSTVSRTRAQLLLSVGLGGPLGAGHSTTVNLGFDLVDPGGATGRPLRVGTSLVTFPVWAYGSAGLAGSSVLVRFPAGFDVRVVAGPLGKPVTGSDGTITLRAGAIPDPLAFNAVVAADQPGSFVSTPVSLILAGQPASVTVRSWPDDPAWGVRMSSLVKRALPLLATEIGLPFQPANPTISIDEALPRSIDGYAADYLPSEGRIQVAYTAGDAVAIHELAHLWFDGSLFSDRWIDDGFAVFYGNRVAQELRLKPTDEAINATLAAAAQPLNAWSGAVPGTTGASTGLADAYGRAAAVTIAGQLYTLVGADGLQAVWRAASGREAAYQPPGQTGSSAVSAGPADWRSLLDLIAERSAVDATSLWQRWVVTPSEDALLSARAGARSALSATTSRAAGWPVPAAVSDALNAWQFDAATADLASLNQILDQRDRIAVAASAAGLTPPSTLAAAFAQGATSSALTEASNELQVIDAITTAAASQPASPSIVQQAGLIGTSPELDLSSAGTAFGQGDLAAARDDALAADTAWSQADDTGSFRIRLAVALVLVAAVVFGFAVIQLRRLGRVGRRASQRAGQRVRTTGLGPRPRGTLGHQPVRMARRIRPGPDEGDQSP